MKKILHIPNYYPPHVGGIEDVCYQIVTGLKGSFDQKVICFNDKKNTEIGEYEGVEIIRSGVWKKIFSQSISFKYYKELKRVIEEYNPDFIHLHLPNPFVSILLMKLLPENTKLILHWHSDIIELKQQLIYFFYRYFEKKILKRAYKIITTSPNYLEHSKPLRNFKNKGVVIANSIDYKKLLKKEDDDEEIRKIKEKYNNKKIIFAFGRHVKYKGYEYLIDAAPFISSEAVLVIAGKGELTDKLKERAKDKEKEIYFSGRISDDELRWYLYASDIFAFPSITKNEAFGLALAEALYTGLPAVTFTIQGSGVNWVSINEETGLEAKNRDSKGYAENINRLLGDDELRFTLGQNARQRVEDTFVWDKIQDKVFDLYR